MKKGLLITALVPLLLCSCSTEEPLKMGYTWSFFPFTRNVTRVGVTTEAQQGLSCLFDVSMAAERGGSAKSFNEWWFSVGDQEGDDSGYCEPKSPYRGYGCFALKIAITATESPYDDLLPPLYTPIDDFPDPERYTYRSVAIEGMIDAAELIYANEESFEYDFSKVKDTGVSEGIISFSVVYFDDANWTEIDVFEGMSYEERNELSYSNFEAYFYFRLEGPDSDMVHFYYRLPE